MRVAAARREVTGDPSLRCHSGEPPYSIPSRALALQLSADTRAVHAHVGCRRTDDRSARSEPRPACILPAFPASVAWRDQATPRQSAARSACPAHLRNEKIALAHPGAVARMRESPRL